MSKRILAVGNGNTLTEVTPFGTLLVHHWNAVNKQYNRPGYTAHTGDWQGSEKWAAYRGAIVELPSVDELRNYLAPIVQAEREFYSQREYDGVEEPYMAGHPGNGYGL